MTTSRLPHDPHTLVAEFADALRADPMIDCRAFIGGLALGTLAVPRAASAQPARKFARIGILRQLTRLWQFGPSHTVRSEAHVSRRAP